MNKLRLGTPRNIAELMIIPVERINISSHKMKKGVWLYGSKEIAALVIYTPFNLSAFNIEGQELSIEELACEVPDLKKLLEGQTPYLQTGSSRPRKKATLLNSIKAFFKKRKGIKTEDILQGLVEHGIPRVS